VLAYVIAKPRKPEESSRAELAIPFDLRRRLHEWIDVDEVGSEGFWIWLRAVVPLLPGPAASGSGHLARDLSPPEELRDLRRRLVFYAREHARLAVISDRYARDNQTLSRRLRALESALKTLESAGHRVDIPPDEEASDAIQRYLPARDRRSSRRDAPSRAR
jgi:hypothetical protein